MKKELKVFNELIDTIVKNSIDNKSTITNVNLWAKSWREEMKIELEFSKSKKINNIL